jgi:penicillin-binding protein-related factor A (putative recombinase)
MPTISHIQSAQLAHLKSTNNDKTLNFMLSEFLSNILDPKFARQSSSKAETIYNND